MQYCIIRIASEGGFKNITLSSSIIVVNGTSEMLVECILHTFKEGRGMLKACKQVTKRMYPNRLDLLALIPGLSKLTLPKLTKGGWVTTDTCNPARRFRKLLISAISDIAKDDGMKAEDIRMYEAGNFIVIGIQ